LVIGIIGKRQSGKDTTAEYLGRTRHNFVRYAFADPIKKACREMFGFTDEQCWGKDKEKTDEHWGVTPREVFQVFGTEFAQYFLPEKIKGLAKIGRYFWVHRFIRWFRENKEKNIAIPDCRFVHEVKALRQLSSEVPVRIIKIAREMKHNHAVFDMHPSEKEMEKITDIDAIFLNDSTIPNLEKQIGRKVSLWLDEDQNV